MTINWISLTLVVAVITWSTFLIINTFAAS
jgi:hypothetical protein